MTKHSIALTAVAAAAIATGAIAAAASGQSAPTTLQLSTHPTHFAFIDVAPKGGPSKPLSQGDSFAIGGPLVENGKAVGTSNLHCTVTQPGRKGLTACYGTAVLPEGDITFTGVEGIAGNSAVFAVTGGTGTYANASGTIDVKEQRGDKSALTVKLAS